MCSFAAARNHEDKGRSSPGFSNAKNPDFATSGGSHQSSGALGNSEASTQTPPSSRRRDRTTSDKAGAVISRYLTADPPSSASTSSLTKIRNSYPGFKSAH